VNEHDFIDRIIAAAHNSPHSGSGFEPILTPDGGVPIDGDPRLALDSTIADVQQQLAAAGDGQTVEVWLKVPLQIRKTTA